MNSAGKTSEDFSAKVIKSWEESDEIHNCDPEKTSLFLFLRKINQPKAGILKIESKHTDIFPLSQSQRALWLSNQNGTKSALWHFALTFRIQSEVDVSALRGAFQELMNRHPSLRTTFSFHNGEPFQEVNRNQQICFEQIDTTNLTWEEINNQIAISCQHSFNLKKGPLMRVSLFSRTQEEHFLLLHMHQIIFDAWSSLILLDELQILYSAQKAGTSAFLMPPQCH
ncbi:MAG: condensation domain-containing protein [bacterium]